ncbi:hypothetical protein [Vandammella animalimorsus]|uniref:hypothetical protein n=1 Tax=Vandammella animalimorsus TaxID=2029117 RepID=UPI0011787F50|nr:hypothetical protein [Vandammella animalimorsus]
MKFLSFEDPDYEKYENYILFNFCQIPPIEQMGFFYVSDFLPVKKEEHCRDLSIDCDYNKDIVNPIYQLFVSGFLYSFKFMELVEEIFDDVSFFRVEGLMEMTFPNDFKKKFFEDIYFNTSIDGFLHGSYWGEVRLRAESILIECGLLDKISFARPIKFRGFLYPDDFNEYKKIPYWSAYGEVISFDEWSKLRGGVFKNYEKCILNFPDLII